MGQAEYSMLEQYDIREARKMVVGGNQLCAVLLCGSVNDRVGHGEFVSQAKFDGKDSEGLIERKNDVFQCY